MKKSKLLSTVSRRLAAGILVAATATAVLAAGGTGQWSAAPPILNSVGEVATTRKVAFGLTDGGDSLFARDARTEAVLWQSLGDQYTEATDLAMKGTVAAVVGDNYDGGIKAAIELFDVKIGANLGGHVFDDQVGSGFDRVAVGKKAIIAGGWAAPALPPRR